MTAQNLKKDFKTSRGVVIHYEVCDSNKGKLALVFLHGIGGNLKAWDKERSFFKDKKISTIAIDFRGHGLSESPKDPNAYKISDLSHDVFDVLNNENFKSYVIVGHCLGGMVTIDFELTYPNITKAIILVDSSFKTPVLSKPLKEHDAAIRILKLVAEHSPRYKIHKEAAMDPFIGSADIDIPRLTSDILHTSLRTWLLLMKDSLTFDTSRLIGNINKPVLIIQGMKDIIIPARTAELLKERIRNSLVDYIPNANHVLVINNPIDLSEEIYKFINLIK